jgi:broad specificity phosphatase PhoE
MIVYFVRHGEGHHNANNLYSLPDFELTEKGKAEAKAAGGRLKSLPIELFIVSSYKRTQQTAEIIIKEVGDKPHILSDLPVEVKRPSEIAGKRIDLPENIEIRKLMDKNIDDPDWHFSDEENFYDLKNRAFEFLKHLEEYSEKHIAVVSHSVFIKMVGLIIIAGEELTPSIFNRSYKGLKLATSGLTVCSFKDGLWSVDTWNDQSHLADNENSKKGE